MPFEVTHADVELRERVSLIRCLDIPLESFGVIEALDLGIVHRRPFDGGVEHARDVRNDAVYAASGKIEQQILLCFVAFDVRETGARLIVLRPFLAGRAFDAEGITEIDGR